MNLLDIKFECCQCGQRLVVESSAAGLNTDCPSCRTELEVPPRTSRHLLPGGEAEIDPETHLLRQELAGASLLASEREREMVILHDKLIAARHEAASLREDRERRAAEWSGWQKERGELRQQLQAETKARTELKEARELARQLATAQAAQLSCREREAAEALATAGGLRDELRALEGRLGDIEARFAQAQLELQAKAELERAVATLRGKEQEAETLARTCAQLQEETAAQKRQLNDSADGRELLALRERLRATQDEAAKAERVAAHAAAEAEKARLNLAREQSNLELLRKRCAEAEKRAESHSETASESLRGIVERQKSELLEQYALVGRLRRAQYGARILYSLVVMLILGGAAAVIFWAQHSALLAEWFK